MLKNNILKMNDVLNVILIHTNYFKDILINDDKLIIIILSLLNKNYYKSINNVYRNYIVNKFPKIVYLEPEVFRCVSWIQLYWFIFTCPLREIIFRNVEFKNEDILLIRKFQSCRNISIFRVSDNGELFADHKIIKNIKLKNEIKNFLRKLN